MDRKQLTLYCFLAFLQLKVEARPFTIPDYGRWLIPTVGSVWVIMTFIKLRL